MTQHDVTQHHAQTPAIQIILLNWNGRDDTLACLESLRQLDYPAYHVILADNGSSDGSVAAIREAFPEVEIIENGANLGFAEGNNRGIARALESNAEFILLLNNDTVVDPGMLTALVQAAERMPRGGVYGPKIYFFDEPNKLWYAGGYWDARTLSFGEHGAGEEDRGQFDTLAETDWVIGCAMFVRAEVFRAVGMLEPSYFLNNEEIDFCSRVRRAGHPCVYVPHARMWHKISVSFGGEHSPMKEYFSARNRLLWAQRNATWPLRLRIHLSSTRQLVQRFLAPLLGYRVPTPFTLKDWWWTINEAFRDPRNRAYFLGFRDFWLGRFGNCPEVVRVLAKQWAAQQRAAKQAQATQPTAASPAGPR